MSQLRKLIVLTPEQLHRLRGRDRELTDHYDANRRHVLGSVVENVKKIGPTQAYAQYQAAQQRHLHHAAREREAPLQMVFADPPAAAPTLEEKLQKLEEQGEERRQHEQRASEQEGLRLAEVQRREKEEEAKEKRRKREEENTRRAARLAEAKKREKEEAKLRRAARSAQKTKERLATARQPEPSKENRLHSKVSLGGVHDISPLKTRSYNVKRGAEYLLEHPGEAKWLRLRQ